MAETNAPVLTLEAITRERIFEASVLRQPHWLRDGRRFSFLDNAPDSTTTTVWLYDITTGERKMVVPPEALKVSIPGENEARTLAITGYQWSPDESRLLFARIPHWRSDRGDKEVFIYDIPSGKMERVLASSEEHYGVKWAPDGKHIGYVRQGDIYLLECASGKEFRLTNTAAPFIYNGRFGWVYEEELSLVDGWAFSPDGRHIAYYQIDETQVPEIDLPQYSRLHMEPVRIRYPKAGDPNPLVKIGVIALEGLDGSVVPPTRWVSIGSDPDIYIARMQWTPQNQLLLQRIPRHQNRIDLLLGDPATGETKTLFSEVSSTWVESPGDVFFVENSDQFLWPSDRNGYQHLYLYDTKGTLLRQLTSGNWDVDRVVGLDSQHRIAFFTAARPNPTQRHIYSVLLDGGGEMMQLSDEAGTHSPLFSPDGQHYLDTFSSIASAPKITLHQASGRPISTVHKNPMSQLKNIPLGSWEFHTFRTSDGLELYAALLKPADFDPNKRYPVVMSVYGGPGSQTVRDAYGSGNGFEQLFASKGYLCAMVDGRGTGMRGRDFEKIVYQNLGHYEVEDQIAGAKWLGSLPYVDSKRIGIWGWSYGGYMASLCILRGASVFRSAIAVAPVTHWELYDSIYTERYMRRPADNPDGYVHSSPITYADRLEGHFLLIHGTADDNVHFQNSMRLAAALQQAGKTFRMMVYPDKHHGLEGMAEHLYNTMIDFFTETLS